MRHEFPVAVKRAAFERAGGQCEAVGLRYGFPPGVRCQRPVLPKRVNYEHYPRGAHDPDPETRTLANCTAICPECNQHANNRHDTPREQKIKNISHDEAVHRAKMARKAGHDVADPAPPRGRQGKKRPLRSAPFRRGQKIKIPTRPFPKRL